jgi:hypothetical protein
MVGVAGDQLSLQVDGERLERLKNLPVCKWMSIGNNIAARRRAINFVHKLATNTFRMDHLNARKLLDVKE